MTSDTLEQDEVPVSLEVRVEVEFRLKMDEKDKKMGYAVERRVVSAAAAKRTHA